MKSTLNKQIMEKILVSIILMGMMTTAAAQNTSTPEQDYERKKKCKDITI
jgi:hypothetical protein